MLVGTIENGTTTTPGYPGTVISLVVGKFGGNDVMNLVGRYTGDGGNGTDVGILGLTGIDGGTGANGCVDGTYVKWLNGTDVGKTYVGTITPVDD